MAHINNKSTAGEVLNFVLFHRYISDDEGYPESSVNFLWNAESIVESLPSSSPAPEDLIIELIKLFGTEYPG
jgi:hypothetical protein